MTNLVSNKDRPPKAEDQKDNKTQTVPLRIRRGLGNLALSLSLLTGSACSVYQEAFTADQEQVEDQSGDVPTRADCNPRPLDSESPFEVGDNPERNLVVDFSPGIKPLAVELRLTDLGWYMLYCGQPEIIDSSEAKDLCPDRPEPDHCYDYRFELVSNPAYEWGKINVPESESEANQEKALRHGLLHLIYDHFYQLGKAGGLNQSIRQAAELDPEIEARVFANHSAASQDSQDSYGHYLLMSELHTELFASRNLPPDLRQHYERYFQSFEIADLADQIGLTQFGRDLLAEPEVRIFSEPDHGGFTCGDGVMGCYKLHGKSEGGSESHTFEFPGQIKLLDQPFLGVPLAHELLHLAYYKYFNQEDINRINKWVREGLNQHPELERLLVDDLGIKDPGLLYSEGYSYLAHSVRELPAELESNYAMFFKDRQIVVDLNNEWAAVFHLNEKSQQAE